MMCIKIILSFVQYNEVTLNKPPAPEAIRAYKGDDFYEKFLYEKNTGRNLVTSDSVIGSACDDVRYCGC